MSLESATSVEETLGLCQHEDGVELPSQGQDPVQCYCLVTLHVSEAPASSAVNLRAKGVSPRVELVKSSPDLYL